MNRSFLLIHLCLVALPVLARPHPEAPLPAGVTLVDAEGWDNGVKFVDLNGDGHEDLVFSNQERYGVYLYNPVERKNLGWTLGWPHVIRAGKAGEANALPLTTKPDVEFKDGAMWVAGVRGMAFEELCRPPHAPPRTPEESLRAIHVKPGFVAELVAAEPLVQDPVFVDWGADGRMWVVEMSDYPFHEQGGKKFPGRVKILTDTNGDGVYDLATTFLDDLQYPTGLALWKGGAFVISVPDVIFAEDTDGDGKADQRKSVLQGFTLGNPQHLVNGFAWGLDGWLYGGNGDSGGMVKEARSGTTHNLSGRDFRFNPQTGEFQLQAGKAQYGRWRDDFGNWFANNNANLGWHYFLEQRYLTRNPKLAVRSMKQDLNSGGTKLFPASLPVPRLNQPETTNTLTSGCSPMPYRDEIFGEQYASSLFICEPVHNLVHHEVLHADGISFQSQRAADERESEFLASEDTWSRFTQARTGPDGALYVVDFYRLIIEHPEWIPEQMVAHLDLRAGSDRGRIYRIKPTAQKGVTLPNLAQLDQDMLVKHLASSNGWVRDTAQRLLIERGSQWHTETLSGNPAAQVQQLWSMHTLGTLPLNLLKNALRDKDERIREHAVRLAEPHLADQTVLAAVSALADDPAVRVRVQVAFTLGESQDPSLANLFSALAKRDAATRGMLIALLSSAPAHPEASQWQAMLVGDQPAKNTLPLPKILTNTNPDRAKVVQSYAEVVTLTGDAARGHTLYTNVCAACHRLKQEGNEIGPDLSTVAAKPMEQLIEAILDPNRAVEMRFLTHTITLRDGTLQAGMIAEETANSITLKLAGTTAVHLRSDIIKTEASTKSLMPDGLESVLTPQQLADVLAWMRSPPDR